MSTGKDKMKAWVEHYARLLNVEFEWPSDELTEVSSTVSPLPSVSTTLIHKPLLKMKCGKDTSPYGIIAEILKTANDEEVELTRQLMKAIFSNDKVQTD